jgi:hypothetical protein
MTTQRVTALSVAAIIASVVNVSPAAPTELDSGVTQQTRTIGTVRSTATPTRSTRTDLEGDRVFHPDYSRALSVEQLTAAWNAEIDRLFPVPVTGGG